VELKVMVFVAVQAVIVMFVPGTRVSVSVPELANIREELALTVANDCWLVI
jgi:hypothetical protein